MILKDVIDFENYEISDCGRIFSKERFVLNNGTKILRKRQELKPADNGLGYLQVGLTKNGKRVRKYVHRLVAQAFIGECPENMEVNHKDLNKKNNHISNLEYTTHSYNSKHQFHSKRN